MSSEYLLGLSIESWKDISEILRNIAFVFGGILAALGVYLAWRRTKALALQAETDANRLGIQSEGDAERRLTDRYLASIENLGSEHMAAKLAGIYALEKIAADSKEYHWTIMEMLTGFIRATSVLKDVQNGEQKENPQLAIDTQAIMTVISRRMRHSEEVLDFQKLDFSHSNLTGLHFSELTFENPRFICANFDYAIMKHASLPNADLTAARFFKADLSHSDLSNADMTSAELQSANLSHISLVNANLSNSKCWYTDFSDGVLRKVNLKNADLTSCILKDAILWESDLENVTLKDTNLSGADLRHVVGLTQQMLDEAFGDKNTKLPDKFTIRIEEFANNQ